MSDDKSVIKNGDRATFALYASGTPGLHILSITSPVGHEANSITGRHYVSVVDLFALSLAMGEYSQKIKA